MSNNYLDKNGLDTVLESIKNTIDETYVTKLELEDNELVVATALNKHEKQLLEIPTKISELENDSNYATLDEIPTKVSDLENDLEFVVKNDIIDNEKVVAAALNDLNDRVNGISDSIKTDSDNRLNIQNSSGVSLTSDEGSITLTNNSEKGINLEAPDSYIRIHPNSINEYSDGLFDITGNTSLKLHSNDVIGIHSLESTTIYGEGGVLVHSTDENVELLQGDSLAPEARITLTKGGELEMFSKYDGHISTDNDLKIAASKVYISSRKGLEHHNEIMISNGEIKHRVNENISLSLQEGKERINIVAPEVRWIEKLKLSNGTYIDKEHLLSEELFIKHYDYIYNNNSSRDIILNSDRNGYTYLGTSRASNNATSIEFEEDNYIEFNNNNGNIYLCPYNKAYYNSKEIAVVDNIPTKLSLLQDDVNHVTTDTEQTISGAKTFTSGVTIKNSTSTNGYKMEYDNTNKCLKFVFV